MPEPAFAAKVPFGRTGLMVSRIGLGASYGAKAASYDEAWERGVNFFYWGSRRRGLMGATLKRVCASRREDLVLEVQSYSRSAWWLRRSTESALMRLGTDYADVLLLGWFNHEPPARILDAARQLKEEGKVRFVAMSGHNRKLFPDLLDHAVIDAWHVRYNAVHRGAESEVWPCLHGRDRAARPGVVSYTNTRWGALCDPRKTPPGERTPSGTDCYRFALTRPEVDVAMAGPDDAEQMAQALASMEAGPMDAEELAWMARVGDHIYGKSRLSPVMDAT